MRPADTSELDETIRETAEPEQFPHPSPQRQRAGWKPLNGRWDFHIEKEGRDHPAGVTWDKSIMVPFSPETAASGIGETGLHSLSGTGIKFNLTKRLILMRIIKIIKI